jgi:hypothetical protein
MGISVGDLTFPFFTTTMAELSAHGFRFSFRQCVRV